ncbi:MAG TPA: DUF1499 domain-containing protein [Candidatus Binataceae bacterium]|nr:DUF1499 domain-containing protein [Candidatus Binataceae bacterium]
METQVLTLLQSFLGSGPQRLAAEIVLGALVLVLLSIYLRGPIATLCRIAVFVCSMAVIIGGVAILMNNVSLAGPPNAAVRLQRFLTVDWAATSEKGDGAAPCADPAELAARQPAGTEHRARRHERRTAAPTTGSAAATGDAVGGEAEQGFPELVRNSYPGITPVRLMRIAASTVSGLPGWQIVSSDPKTLTIDAVYHTRLLGFVDDVRIIVTPRSEIDLCSRSRVGEPGSQSPLGFFRGDFGANIGHIKEFDLALAPAADEAYREIEIQDTARQHGVRIVSP